jgi:hypothetical protein
VLKIPLKLCVFTGSLQAMALFGLDGPIKKQQAAQQICPPENARGKKCHSNLHVLCQEINKTASECYGIMMVVELSIFTLTRREGRIELGGKRAHHTSNVPSFHAGSSSCNRRHQRHDCIREYSSFIGNRSFFFNLLVLHAIQQVNSPSTIMFFSVRKHPIRASAWLPGAGFLLPTGTIEVELVVPYLFSSIVRMRLSTLSCVMPCLTETVYSTNGLTFNGRVEARFHDEYAICLRQVDAHGPCSGTIQQQQQQHAC